MPAVYFFLIDVSMNAVHTGATAAACSAISQALSDLPVSFHGSFFVHLLVYYKTAWCHL
jgi:protein transport protein SEC24